MRFHAVQIIGAKGSAGNSCIIRQVQTVTHRPRSGYRASTVRPMPGTEAQTGTGTSSTGSAMSARLALINRPADRAAIAKNTAPMAKPTVYPWI